ncbi:MAG: helix-turn-helix transcriptional regulator [Clostridiales bacterium]|nr:helix-turn-helix transcriptional regulator [Clostridiales bacterium]
MTEFGNRLRELRNEKGISQQTLALEIQHSQQVISNWESGNVEPTASAIVSVADYFDVSTDYLLGRKEF